MHKGRGNGPTGNGSGKNKRPLKNKVASFKNDDQFGDPFINKTIVDRYFIQRLIDEGSFGAVYRAIDETNGMLVAVKILRPQVTNDPEMVERFLKREVRAMMEVDHPNIVRGIDVGAVGNTYFVVMEYVDGTPLSSIIKKAGKMHLRDVEDIILQACEGFYAAHTHKKKIIHRDIAPKNIMLVTKGREKTVKILDFGLAKFTHEAWKKSNLTGGGDLMGTAPYMAPEQILSSRDVDHRADIYSIGATMYHLLSGLVPLDAETLPLIFEKIKNEIPKRPSERVDGLGIPEYFENIIMWCLAKDRTRRPQTVEELMRAIRDGAPMKRFDDASGPHPKNVDGPPHWWIAQQESIPREVEIMGELEKTNPGIRRRQLGIAREIEGVPPREVRKFPRWLAKTLVTLGVVGALVGGWRVAYHFRDRLPENVKQTLEDVEQYAKKAWEYLVGKRITFEVNTWPGNASVYLETADGEEFLGETDRKGVLRFDKTKGRHVLIIRKKGYLEKKVWVSHKKILVQATLEEVPRKTVELEEPEVLTSEPDAELPPDDSGGNE